MKKMFLMKKRKSHKLFTVMVILMLILCVFLSGCGGSSSQSDKDACTIIYNGVVEQAEGDVKNPTAVVVEGDEIIYVGDDDNAMEYKTDDSTLYDADGNTIMPSMVESHMHFSTAMQAMYEIDLADYVDAKDMQEAIAAFIEEHPDMEVYNGSGWMQSAFSTKTGPTADILDEVCADKPIVLQNVDGHGYWANTKALEYVEEQLAAGVDGVIGNTVAEYNEHFQENGGRIVVDKNGKPSGWLKESAGNLINGLLNAYSVDECKAAIAEQQEWLASLGFTTFFDAGTLMNGETVDNYYTAMSEMARDGELKVRVRSSFWVQPYDFNVLGKDGKYDAQASSKALDKYLKEWKERADSLSETEYFKVTTIKMMADQVLEGGTAYLSDGMYSDEFVKENLSGNYENNNVWAGKDDLMVQAFEFAAKNDLNLHVHTIGDAAVTMYLNNLEKAVEKYPELKEGRVSVAHCQFVTEKDQKRLAEMGVSAIVAPYWACMDDYYWDVYLPIMSSKEKLDTQYPMQSLEEKGINVAFHSDYVVTVPDMGWLYYSAQTRTLPQKIYNLWYEGYEDEYVRNTDPKASQNIDDYDKGVTPILPLKDYGERLNLQQVLDASTINGAKTLNLEDQIGTIKAGKKADIMILNMNLVETNKSDIEQVETVAPTLTLFEGEVVYDKTKEKNK